MSNLLRATGDAEKSQRDMAVALDVAAATGKSVESVTQAMAKGYGGSAGSLKKLVPTLSDAAVESGNMNKVMKELADQTGARQQQRLRLLQARCSGLAWPWERHRKPLEGRCFLSWRR